jgi:hypothetical protein
MKLPDIFRTFGCCFLVFLVIIAATLPLLAFGFLWYCLIHEPISSAIMGIVCGLIADFIIWSVIS